MFNRKSDKLDLIIGKNSKITGEVESTGTTLIEGTIIGNLHGEKVILGEKSYVKGSIFANSISIAGKIEGSLKGTESIEVKETGCISGDIMARRMSMMKGAIFNGMCRMDDAHQGQIEEAEQKVVEFAAKER
ncbi:MAG TPA: polymer-forming cytoskeletal protein [Syntrophales bacterium]|nr:polymer-forming cytoskeletal protein [Syntrophales bacterium]